ncbi:MAG: hypothetical protein AAFY15_01795, partial [Cyanobacteria bacterium J06648_11]
MGDCIEYALKDAGLVMRDSHYLYMTVNLGGRYLAQLSAVASAIAWVAFSTPSAPVNPPGPGLRPLQYREVLLTRGIAHVLIIPAESEYIVTPAVAPELATVTEFATETEAIAVLNGGFFDPNNQQTTSHVIHAGNVLADPAQNLRLTGNPALEPYLAAILNRSEFRQYDCAGDRRYDIALHTDPVPAPCTLLDALGAGPQL